MEEMAMTNNTFYSYREDYWREPTVCSCMPVAGCVG
jgi:hypothetical protein